MNDTENNNREYEKKRDFGEAPANRIDERDVDFALNGRRDLLVRLPVDVAGDSRNFVWQWTD